MNRTNTATRSTTRRITAGALALLAACSLAACSDTTPTANTNAGTAPAWMLASAPDNALPVVRAKQTAQAGDTVAVRGIIGGHIDALRADSNVFRIVDTSLNNPCLAEDDHCPTPWDYCCTPREDVAANSAAVQIAADTGSEIDPIAAGLSPLDEVIVVGTVASASADALTIKAVGVHRVDN